MSSLLLLGLLFGMRHALEADHLAALASLASDNNTIQKTVKHGVVWGLGHTLALFIFGSLSLLLATSMNQQLTHLLELLVGLMLILLGLDVLRKLIKKRIHFHTHQHDRETHFHAHSHAGEAKGQHNPEKHEHKHADKFPMRALFVGLMHGMAGSAALIVLTLQTVSSPYQGMSYILFFGVGSIIGMAMLSFVIALPLRYSAKGLTWLHNGLHLLIACVTVGIGLLLVYENIQGVGLLL